MNRDRLFYIEMKKCEFLLRELAIKYRDMPLYYADMMTLAKHNYEYLEAYLICKMEYKEVR